MIEGRRARKTNFERRSKYGKRMMNKGLGRGGDRDVEVTARMATKPPGVLATSQASRICAVAGWLA
jgi:hypothetical protein